MKMNPTAMVGAACAGMFRFLFGAALAAVVVSGEPNPVACLAISAAYLILSGLWKIGTAFDATGDLEDALDRPERKPVQPGEVF